MAKFKVGDRVRIVAPRTLMQFIGREGVIVAIPAQEAESDCSVLIDGYDARSNGYSYPTAAFRFSALRPILPEHDADFERFMQKITKTEPIVEMVRLLDQQVRA